VPPPVGLLPATADVALVATWRPFVHRFAARLSVR
jgi:hypothetical protein